jgi:hypothetical protein
MIHTIHLIGLHFTRWLPDSFVAFILDPCPTIDSLFSIKKFSELLFYYPCDTLWLAQTSLVFPVPALVLQSCYFTRWRPSQKQSIQYRDTRVALAIPKCLPCVYHRWLKGIDVSNEMSSAVSDTKTFWHTLPPHAVSYQRFHYHRVLPFCAASL